MSLNDKSKKELSDMAKGLGLKFNAKADKKVLINIIEAHNKVELQKEHEKKDLIETVMDSKTERITIEGLKDIEEARAEMTDQASDEKINQLDINRAVTQHHDSDNMSEHVSTIFEKTSNKNDYDNNSYSEGYREKISYNQL